MQIEDVGATRNPAFSGALLRAARARRGWSQGQLAARLEVGVPTVGAWERGARTPSPPLLMRIAQTLEIDAETLLTVPRREWTLTDFRVIGGLHQREAAQQLNLTTDRLSHLEAAYERGSDELFQRMADLYHVDPGQLRDAWERARSRLLDDGENGG